MASKTAANVKKSNNTGGGGVGGGPSSNATSSEPLAPVYTRVANQPIVAKAGSDGAVVVATVRRNSDVSNHHVGGNIPSNENNKPGWIRGNPTKAQKVRLQREEALHQQQHSHNNADNTTTTAPMESEQETAMRRQAFHSKFAEKRFLVGVNAELAAVVTPQREAGGGGGAGPPSPSPKNVAPARRLSNRSPPRQPQAPTTAVVDDDDVTTPQKKQQQQQPTGTASPSVNTNRSKSSPPIAQRSPPMKNIVGGGSNTLVSAVAAAVGAAAAEKKGGGGAAVAATVTSSETSSSAPPTAAAASSSSTLTSPVRDINNNPRRNPNLSPMKQRGEGGGGNVAAAAVGTRSPPPPTTLTGAAAINNKRGLLPQLPSSSAADTATTTTTGAPIRKVAGVNGSGTNTVAKTSAAAATNHISNPSAAAAAPVMLAPLQQHQHGTTRPVKVVEVTIDAIDDDDGSVEYCTPTTNAKKTVKQQQQGGGGKASPQQQRSVNSGRGNNNKTAGAFPTTTATDNNQRKAAVANVQQHRSSSSIEYSPTVPRPQRSSLEESNNNANNSNGPSSPAGAVGGVGGNHAAAVSGGRSPAATESPTRTRTFEPPSAAETLRKYREMQHAIANSKRGGLGANITAETQQKLMLQQKQREYGKNAASTALGIGSEEMVAKAKEQIEKDRKERLEAQKVLKKENEAYLLLVDKLRHKGERDYQPLSPTKVVEHSASPSSSPASQTTSPKKIRGDGDLVADSSASPTAANNKETVADGNDEEVTATTPSKRSGPPTVQPASAPSITTAASIPPQQLQRMAVLQQQLLIAQITGGSSATSNPSSGGNNSTTPPTGITTSKLTDAVVDAFVYLTDATNQPLITTAKSSSIGADHTNKSAVVDLDSFFLGFSSSDDEDDNNTNVGNANAAAGGAGGILLPYPTDVMALLVEGNCVGLNRNGAADVVSSAKMRKKNRGQQQQQQQGAATASSASPTLPSPSSTKASSLAAAIDVNNVIPPTAKLAETHRVLQKQRRDLLKMNLKATRKLLMMGMAAEGGGSVDVGTLANSHNSNNANNSTISPSKAVPPTAVALPFQHADPNNLLMPTVVCAACSSDGNKKIKGSSTSSGAPVEGFTAFGTLFPSLNLSALAADDDDEDYENVAKTSSSAGPTTTPPIVDEASVRAHQDYLFGRLHNLAEEHMPFVATRSVGKEVDIFVGNDEEDAAGKPREEGGEDDPAAADSPTPTKSITPVPLYQPHMSDVLQLYPSDSTFMRTHKLALLKKLLVEVGGVSEAVVRGIDTSAGSGGYDGNAASRYSNTNYTKQKPCYCLAKGAPPLHYDSDTPHVLTEAEIATITLVPFGHLPRTLLPQTAHAAVSSPLRGGAAVAKPTAVDRSGGAPQRAISNGAAVAGGRKPSLITNGVANGAAQKKTRQQQQQLRTVEVAANEVTTKVTPSNPNDDSTGGEESAELRPTTAPAAEDNDSGMGVGKEEEEEEPIIAPPPPPLSPKPSTTAPAASKPTAAPKNPFDDETLKMCYGNDKKKAPTAATNGGGVKSSPRHLNKPGGGADHLHRSGADPTTASSSSASPRNAGVTEGPKQHTSSSTRSLLTPQQERELERLRREHAADAKRLRELQAQLEEMGGSH